MQLIITFMLFVLVSTSPLPNNSTTLSNNSTTLSNNSTSLSENICTNKALLEKIKTVVNDASPGIQHLGNIPAYAATSCQQIASFRPKAESGYYWIQENSGPVRVYCQIGGACGEGVWMQAANVNMTETNSKCPSGLELITSPKRLCRKNVNIGCSSTKFSTFGITFSKVCGQVIGYQNYSTDAFRPYYANQGHTIDDLYVDGVSVTYSSHPRQHIWTFAAAGSAVPMYNRGACPCVNSLSHVEFTGLIPEFIGKDYYCETAARTAFNVQRVLVEDPLWDGEGCGRFSTCCEGERKPWFVKDLAQLVTSDIEVRVCADQIRSDEDILIEVISIFVQ